MACLGSTITVKDGVSAVATGALPLTNALGGGLVTLPSSGWGLIVGLLVYTLVIDLGEFVFHRAQHRYPLLWAKHALHHSDEAMNVAPTLGHFWAEGGFC